MIFCWLDVSLSQGQQLYKLWSSSTRLPSPSCHLWTSDPCPILSHCRRAVLSPAHHPCPWLGFQQHLFPFLLLRIHFCDHAFGFISLPNPTISLLIYVCCFLFSSLEFFFFLVWILCLTVIYNILFLKKTFLSGDIFAKIIWWLLWNICFEWRAFFPCLPFAECLHGRGAWKVLSGVAVNLEFWSATTEQILKGLQDLPTLRMSPACHSACVHVYMICQHLLF